MTVDQIVVDVVTTNLPKGICMLSLNLFCFLVHGVAFTQEKNNQDAGKSAGLAQEKTPGHYSHCSAQCVDISLF